MHISPDLMVSAWAAAWRGRLIAHARDLGLKGEARVDLACPPRNRKHRQRLFMTLSMAGEPKLVAKLRMDAADLKVGREREVAEGLAARGEPCDTRVLSGDDTGFIMPYVPARDLPDVFAELNAERRVELARRAIERIWRFQQAGATWTRGDAGSVLDDLLGDWRPQDPSLARALSDAPIGPMHGDLGPWNLRCGSEGQDIAIIDWEDYRPRGLPVLDVLNALLTLTLVVHPGYADLSARELYERTFLRAGEMRSLLRQGLEHYERLSGVPVEAALALTPAFCVAMNRRVALEDRPTEHLFYGKLLAHFRAADIFEVA
jgi:hypothetical protein